MKIIYLLLIVTTLSADTFLCIEDNAVGFKWKNKTWVQSKFTSAKYIIKKVKPTSYCQEKNLSNNRPIQERQACYTLSYHGKDTEYISECVETWSVKLDTIKCNFGGINIQFKPTGAFTGSKLPHPLVNLNPSENLKDPIIVFHGECSKL